MARNKDYDEELLDELDELERPSSKRPSKVDKKKKMDDTQDLKPVSKYSEADYGFDDEADEDEEYDEEYDGEYDEEYDDDSEDASFLDKFTKDRMIKFTAVFAGVVVIALVIIAVFVRGKQVTTTVDNVNSSSGNKVSGAVKPTGAEQGTTITPGTNKGEIQIGCLNVTIVPGYVRPDSSLGGGGYTPGKPSQNYEEPEIRVTPTPVITQEIVNTPEVTEEPTPEITDPVDDPTPEITEEPTPEITDSVDDPTPEVTEEPTPEVTDPVEPTNPVDNPDPGSQTTNNN